MTRPAVRSLHFLPLSAALHLAVWAMCSRTPLGTTTPHFSAIPVTILSSDTPPAEPMPGEKPVQEKGAKVIGTSGRHAQRVAPVRGHRSPARRARRREPPKRLDAAEAGSVTGTGWDSGHVGSNAGDGGGTEARGVDGTAMASAGLSGADRVPRYLSEVRRLIELQKRYPEDALRRGSEGVVVVAFVISKSGMISALRLLRADDVALGTAALRAVKEAARFFPPPPGQQSIPIEVALRFEIREQRGKP